jgi:branched-chain amino acid transport system permease protein
MLVLIIGGTGWLYGGLIGALVFKLMQDQIAALTPQYWQFWIGLFLVVFVLVGRERLTGGVGALWRRTDPPPEREVAAQRPEGAEPPTNLNRAAPPSPPVALRATPSPPGRDQ